MAGQAAWMLEGVQAEDGEREGDTEVEVDDGRRRPQLADSHHLLAHSHLHHCEGGSGFLVRDASSSSPLPLPKADIAMRFEQE
jgi:hypothetical protein